MRNVQPPGVGTAAKRPGLIAILALLHGLSAGSVAAVVEVHPGESIQAAIDAPTTQEGDVIVVAPGTYVENLDLHGRAITLRSADPANPEIVAATVLDGGGSDSVITCRSGEGPATVIAGFTITGGFASSGGGMQLDMSSPSVLDCTFIGNEAIFDGGGMWCLDAHPVVVNCRFLGNSAFYGAAVANILASPTFANCLFSGNDAMSSGGAMDNFNDSNPTLVNCALSNNIAANGGAMSNADASPMLFNSILWGNASASGFSDEIFGSGSWFTYCNVAGSGGSDMWNDSVGEDGGGNLDADPMFADADGADDIAGTGDDDLHLTPGSPCMDAGSNLSLPRDDVDLDDDGDREEPLPLDLDHQERFADRQDAPDVGLGEPPLVDMGPYELAAEPPACPADLDGDGRVNARDLVIMLKAAAHGHYGADLDGDGLIDFRDLLTLLHAWGPCADERAEPSGHGTKRGSKGRPDGRGRRGRR